jgi:chitin biosynthesis protein CHS5
MTFSVQILLGERAHLIEFPSILLPHGATTGSIVNIAVHQNIAEERRRDAEFWQLQDEVLQAFGKNIPENPRLEVRLFSFLPHSSYRWLFPPVEKHNSNVGHA